MADLLWIFLDQICLNLNLNKVLQTWSNLIKMEFHQSKNVIIKSCHIYRKDQNDRLIFDFFGSDLSKMGQTWLNFLARNGFLAVMAYLQKLLFVQKYLCQIWSGFLARKGFFSNESALLLKVLKGLARLWCLKAFRLVLPAFYRIMWLMTSSKNFEKIDTFKFFLNFLLLNKIMNSNLYCDAMRHITR